MPGNSLGNAFRTTAELHTLDAGSALRLTDADVEFGANQDGRVRMTVNACRDGEAALGKRTASASVSYAGGTIRRSRPTVRR